MIVYSEETLNRGLLVSVHPGFDVCIDWKTLNQIKTIRKRRSY